MLYAEFIDSKTHGHDQVGFDPIWMPDFLFDFQRWLVEWSIQFGRGAIFADCGMGKTPMQLVWAENIVRKTNRPVLICTPLAVASQTIREAEKFGIEATLSRDGKHGKGIIVTNYERLHYFDCNKFAGVVGDESSILKNFDGATKALFTEFVRRLPYRLLCTATAAPNDYVELGTSSEALGYLGYSDMLTRFFKQLTTKDHLGWGRTKYRLRDQATEPFWRWVCSWARAIRRPSDYGFDDGDFILPDLQVNQTTVESTRPRDGMLFVVPAHTLPEQRAERRMTIAGRCEKVAELASHHEHSVAWCHLNDEGDLLERLIPWAVQVSGKDSDEEKEEKLLAFSSGQIKKLVTKPKIGAWGLNWQHCSHTTMFPSHSFEQYYQAVRRFLRFGQQSTVTVDLVTTPGEEAVLGNLQVKASKADEMFDRLMLHMKDALHIERTDQYSLTEELPTWL